MTDAYSTLQDGDTMARNFVKRLYDLEIDEISVVDRGANQHATVAIAKRDGDSPMGIYDEDGVEVYEDELQHGQVVYDDDGNEFVFVEADPANDDTTAALQGGYEDELEPEREPALVGKSRKIQKNQRPTLGDSVYAELSKALNDGDRDKVIAKAMNEVEVTKRENAYLRSMVEEIQEERELAHYTEIAKGYGLPVDEHKLARILKRAVDTMADDEVEELDRLLSSQSALYEELGTNGSQATSDTMEAIYAMANETVGKAQGVSESQAVVALFDANPEAYDEYLAEQSGR